MRAAIVLAAGSATRFGGGKLLAPFRAEPLLVHAIHAACAAPVARVIVVAHPDIPQAVMTDAAPSAMPKVDVVRLASTALSDSLRAGLNALPDAQSVFVFLGDMPLVPHSVAHELAAALDDGGTAQTLAVLPVHRGQPGHPVLLTARALPLTDSLKADEGLGRLLRGQADVIRLERPEAGVCADVDRREDLARLDDTCP